VSYGSGPDTSLDRLVRLLALALTLAFSIFLLRMVQLQVIESEALALRSAKNSVRTVRLDAPRGDILERDGDVLALTRPAFGVQVIPSELRREEVAYDVLGRLLDDEPDVLRERVGSPRGRARYQPVRLGGDVGFSQYAALRAHLFAMPGVVTDVRARRQYAGGALAAHVLGTLGEVTREQLATRPYAGYRPGDFVGTSGVEKLLEATLRGRNGGRNVVVDVSGREVEEIAEIAPLKGGTVVLTLDVDLQRAARDALANAEPPVPAGAVVALDPRNGDILALVSYPFFDPNDFAAGIGADLWEGLRSDPWKPLQNRAVAGQYPPGSTYKPLLAAAALEDGILRTGDRFFCPGHFRLGRRTYRCWKREGHGWMDVRDALKYSCDVFFYQVGLKLGIDRLAHYARAFGFGRASGSPFPDERSGLVPTREWKERRIKEPWMDGETVSASIGQGFNLVTPLQLAVAFAALAGDGTVYEPRLMLSLFDRDGALVEQPPARARGRVPVDAKHLTLVREALEAVVMESGGTGGRARVPDARIAGKTGTAQVVALKHTEGLEDDEVPVRHRDHAWFAAFAPADAPEIVVVVLVEHGGGGGAVAAPLAQQVLKAFFAERVPASEVARAD